MITVDVLEWVLGRSPADGSDEPWEIRDVDTDGSKLWLVAASVASVEGHRQIQSIATAVPNPNCDRALKLRDLMQNAPEVDFGDEALIDFSTAGDGSLSIYSDWFGIDDPPLTISGPRAGTRTPEKALRHFKKRERKR
jgi:hypothetical protein